MMTVNSRRDLGLIAAAGSAALLLGAYGFQLAGYAPCEMCIWQRWPHAAAILIGVLVWFTRGARGVLLLGAVAAATAAGLGVLHVGVEQGWWQGVTECSGGVSHATQLSPDDFLAKLKDAPLVRCDQPAWSLWGITMAGWNAIFSTLLTVLWLVAAARPARR